MILEKLLSVFKNKKDPKQIMKEKDLRINATIISSDVILFQVNEKLLENQSILVIKKSIAEQSPLLKPIFNLVGVTEVFINDNTMRVKCSANCDLEAIAKKVGNIIRNAWGQEMIPQSLLEEVKNSNSSISIKDDYPILQTDLGREIKRLLSESIAPGLASHGGSVELVDIIGGMVHLKFLGGCQGCSQVSSTVKYGVEKILKEKFPVLKGIIDVTDHTRGENPYYK